MLSFHWEVTPTDAFSAGYRRYVTRVIDTLYGIMVEEAPKVEQFMRSNAVWKDSHDPSRAYLRAVPFKSIESGGESSVGIIAFYDLAVYKQSNPAQSNYNFGELHETFTFPTVGVISIILPRRPGTVLGDEAPRVWDRVRAKFQ